MTFVVKADGKHPLTVILEPWGMEYVLEPGDHFVFEDVDEEDALLVEDAHMPQTLTIWTQSTSRMWDSRGNEMSLIG